MENQPNNQPLKFDQALEELQKVVVSMESSNVSLEELIQLFERGNLLLSHCKEYIQSAEMKVDQLKTKYPLSFQEFK